MKLKTFPVENVRPVSVRLGPVKTGKLKDLAGSQRKV